MVSWLICAFPRCFFGTKTTDMFVTDQHYPVSCVLRMRSTLWRGGGVFRCACTIVISRSRTNQNFWVNVKSRLPSKSRFQFVVLVVAADYNVRTTEEELHILSENRWFRKTRRIITGQNIAKGLVQNGNESFGSRKNRLILNEWTNVECRWVRHKSARWVRSLRWTLRIDDHMTH